MATASELSIDSNASAQDMAEMIFGEGVQVLGASFSGDGRASGIYTDGDQTSPGVVPGDSGVILTTGRVDGFTNGSSSWWWGGSSDPNQNSNTSTDNRGINNDSDFNDAIGASTYDASFLSVDFVPDGDTLTMQFVFASEEYPEYSNSIYNDAVVVWVNGQPVQLSVNDSNTSVGGINDTNEQNLYIDNTGDDYNTEMDGFTVTLTLKMTVIPGQVNSIRIGIADVSDSSYDSAVLIAGGSLQTALIANDDDVTIAPDGTKVIDVLANDEGPGGSELVITHINGQAVSAGDTVTLSTGQQVTLNSDGTFTLVNDSDIEDFNFTYKVSNDGGNGLSDTAFVTVSSIPCFVAGTLIETDRGEVPVERLTPGDRIKTLDDGYQPLRWIGARSVAAEGKFAPIHIRAGSFGDHRDLWVSPQHRILVRDSLVELLFGEGEILVAAKHLVDGDRVQHREGGEVTYVHLMFDRHQIILSEGLATESFLPGPQATDSFERDVLEEICSLFPELDPATGAGYSPAARRTLKAYEAALLNGAGARRAAA